MFTNLLSLKVREFDGVIRNHKDKTEKRLWEIGKRLNFNESISSIVFNLEWFCSRVGYFSSGAGMRFS